MQRELLRRTGDGFHNQRAVQVHTQAVSTDAGPCLAVDLTRLVEEYLYAEAFQNLQRGKMDLFELFGVDYLDRFVRQSRLPPG